MWMEFECETPLVAETPETCQDFSFFRMNGSPGLLDSRTDDKLFFLFFENPG
jgi:hypothetical protein